MCLNYDVAWFEENQLEPPDSLDDLVAPEYQGLLVTEDPAASSPGLAFLLATIERYGSEWQGYWESLVANDVAIVNDWTPPTTRTSPVRGDPIVVWRLLATGRGDVRRGPLDPPTAVVTDGCPARSSGILAGTDNEEAAGRLIDFMLSPGFQEQIPTTWFVFPANVDVELPEVFAENTVIPEEPITMDPAEIEQNREQWLDQWRDIVTP